MGSNPTLSAILPFMVCTFVRTIVLTSSNPSIRILIWGEHAVRFEWDEDKNRRNLRKHDVGFETAVLVFDDPYYLGPLGRLA